LRVLSAYDWRKNNVRELRNIVERLVIATDGDVIRAVHVPPEIRTDGPDSVEGGARTFSDLKAQAEREIILAALNRNEGHVTRTAQELGLADHASLLKIMRRLGIRRD
jgi:DNA-binding NtrC family response regulator